MLELREPLTVVLLSCSCEDRDSTDVAEGRGLLLEVGSLFTDEEEKSGGLQPP